MTFQEWLVDLQKQFNENGYKEFNVEPELFRDAYEDGNSPEDTYENYILAMQDSGDESCEDDDDGCCGSC